MNERVSGNFKFFSPEKGFGFIKVAGQSRDVFVHVSTLAAGWLPRPDEPATLEIEEHERGLRGRNVRPAGTPDGTPDGT